MCLRISAGSVVARGQAGMAQAKVLLGIQPRVKSLRSSCTRLYPHGVESPECCARIEGLERQECFFTLVTGPRRFLSHKLSDIKDKNARTLAEWLLAFCHLINRVRRCTVPVPFNKQGSPFYRTRAISSEPETLSPTSRCLILT